MRRNIYIKAFLSVALLLIATYYTYATLTAEVPRERPKVTIRYNEKVIASTMGEHNWFNMRDGGNSYLAGSSFSVGQKTQSTLANRGDAIEISFSSSPKEAKLLLWQDEKTFAKAYPVTGSEKSYKFNLPNDKGEYIFEVVGNWDETHSTSDVFRIEIK